MIKSCEQSEQYFLTHYELAAIQIVATQILSYSLLTNNSDNLAGVIALIKAFIALTVNSYYPTDDLRLRWGCKNNLIKM